MDIRKVKKLIELLEESGIAEIEISEGEESVRISRYPAGGGSGDRDRRYDVPCGHRGARTQSPMCGGRPRCDHRPARRSVRHC